MSRLRKNIEALTLQNKRARDYDPEDIEQRDHEGSSDDSDDDGAGQVDANLGREHYEKVGKSKLREPESVGLDSKYNGVAVRRKTLDDELSDDEDPFAINDDSENEIDATSDDDEKEEHSQVLSSRNVNGRSKNSPGSSQVDEMSDSLASSDVEGTDNNTEEEEGTDLEDMSDASSIASDEHEQPRVNDKRQQGRDILRAQQQALSMGLAGSLAADVKKGRAVRHQRHAFDRVLDARMKLQKGFIAASDLAGRVQSDELESEAERALSAAKVAALQLFNDITTFRDTTRVSDSQPARSGQKRKRTVDTTPESNLQDQWQILVDLENDSLLSRRSTIDKWSARVKSADPSQAVATSKNGFLDLDAQNRNLTTVLDTFVVNEFDKLTQSAPSNEKLTTVLDAYDDTAFYQSLLRDLIASRSAVSTTTTNMSASLLPQKLHPSGNTNNKRQIDTKASKGRKIRYTVHEKLQNFMAAEGDTGRNTAMWTDRGKDEFFGSLFGQDRALKEDSDDDATNNPTGDQEHEALRLFAS